MRGWHAQIPARGLVLQTVQPGGVLEASVLGADEAAAKAAGAKLWAVPAARVDVHPLAECRARGCKS